MAKREKTNITENVSTYRKERYEKLKKQNLCVICRKPNTNGRVLCNDCSIYMSKKNHIKNNELFEKEICIKCGNINNSQYLHCDSCREKLRIKQRNNRKKSLKMVE